MASVQGATCIGRYGAPQPHRGILIHIPPACLAEAGGQPHCIHGRPHLRPVLLGSFQAGGYGRRHRGDGCPALAAEGLPPLQVGLLQGGGGAATAWERSRSQGHGQGRPARGC